MIAWSLGVRSDWAGVGVAVGMSRISVGEERRAALEAPFEVPRSGALATAHHGRLTAMSRPGPQHRRGGTDFHELMRYRIMDILLVASPYDSFVLEEAGQI